MAKINQDVKSIDSPSEYFHIIFEFHDIKKTGDWSDELFHSTIGNEHRELKENILEDGNKVIYHVKILHPENFQIKFPYKTTEFKSKYKKILKKITIDYHTSKDLNEGDLDWKTLDSFYSDTRNYRFTNDLLSVFYLFTASMDALTLEVYISNILLYQFDPAEREKYIDSLNLEKPYSILRKLFGTTSTLTEKDVRQLFGFIDTNDFIIKKAIFTYLHQKDRSRKLEEFYKTYTNIVGAEPFGERELRDMKYSLSTFDTFFELFFKQYYFFGGLKDKVEQFDDLDKVYKIEIPINPKAYNLKIYAEETTEFIQNKFQNDLRLILNCCERVIYHETKRLLNKRLDNLIVCFDYSTSEEYLEELKENNIYFNNRQDLIVSRIGLCQYLLKNYDKDANPEFRFYCIFEGNYTEMKDTSITWENRFGIKDVDEETILAKYWKHKTYFTEKELGLEVPLVVQAFLHLKYRMRNKKWSIIPKEVYLEIIDLDVVKAFKPISIKLAKNRFGVVKLENTPKGLRKYRYASKGEPSYEIILHKPINLLAYYKGENELFYEIQIGKEKVCKTKSDICNWIELETNFASTSGKDLKDSISNVLFAYIKEKKLTPLPMFHTAGVFLKEDEFAIVHPFKENLTVIGENDIQYEYIERIKDKGLDVNGDLIKAFYDVLEINGLREDIRAGIFGYSSIQPFFFALSKVLDIFPNLFVIGIHGSGKTTFTEILFNFLFGTKMKSADSIDSTARITKYSTESPFILNIDDIDILEDKLMNFIKTSSTRKGTRDRLTRDQKLLSEQTYASYSGTANNRNFLAGNENDAFRKRCLIFETMEGIDIVEDTAIFEEVKFNIAEGKIVGFYLLEKAIDFFKSLSTNRDITAYFKLIAHINEIRKKLKQKIIEKEIPLSDGRRLTIYTLIYIGWEIWEYIFTQNSLKSKILKKYLDLNEAIFWNFIKGLEETEMDITITTFDSVLEFFEQKRELFSDKTTSKGDIFIQTNFIEQYDKFAKMRGYDTLRNLKEFAHLQSQILGYDVETGTKRIRNSEDGSSKTEHGCIFHYKLIKDIRLKRVKDGFSMEDKKEMPDLTKKVWEIFEANGFKTVDINDLQEVLEVYFEDRNYVENALDYLFDNDFLAVFSIDEDKCEIRKEKFDHKFQ